MNKSSTDGVFCRINAAQKSTSKQYERQITVIAKQLAANHNVDRTAPERKASTFPTVATSSSGKRLKKSDMKANVRGNAGFTLVEVMIVGAIIGLLASISIPNFIKARDRAQIDSCISSLRSIDGMKQQWALEAKQASSAVPVETDLQPYFLRGTSGRMPVCPAAGDAATFNSSYNINAVDTRPECQIAPGIHELP